MKAHHLLALAFAAAALFAACTSTNPVCDSADLLDLSSKTNDCVGIDAGNPLQGHDNCNAKIKGCTADDQATLQAMVNCLSNLGVCQRNTQANWEKQVQDCLSGATVLGPVCQTQFFPQPTGGGAGGGLGGGTGGGGGGQMDGGAETLPCDVAGVIGTWCGKCHAEPASNGAPYSLWKRSDFLRVSPSDANASIGQRCVYRMQATDIPMPPDPEPKPSAAEVQVISDWVTAGLPDGTCTPDAGAVDAGPAPVTCQGNQMFPPLTSASSAMAPGWACVACHKGQNFQNQNTQGYTAYSRAYFFMGTVFPDWHENDLCEDSLPSGTQVQIFDASGALALTLSVNSVGNFYSGSVAAGVTLPYTARVKSPSGAVRWMLTPQGIGDCNTCHTVQGTTGAPGRITLP